MQMKTTKRYHFIIGRLVTKNQTTKVSKDVEKLEPLCVAGGNGTAATENSMAIHQKIKQNYNTIRRSHFWVDTQNNLKQGLEQISVHSHLEQH